MERKIKAKIVYYNDHFLFGGTHDFMWIGLILHPSVSDEAAYYLAGAKDMEERKNMEIGEFEITIKS